MNKNAMILGGVVLALAVLVGGWLFMQNQGSPAQNSAATPTATSTPVVQEEPTSSGSADEGAMSETVKSFDVEAVSFSYDPKEIRVKKGETVEITLTAGDATHNFNIDEFNVKSDTVKAGDSTVVEFVADKTGTFEYYCSVGQHRKQGQVGKLIVE